MAATRHVRAIANIPNHCVIAEADAGTVFKKLGELQELRRIQSAMAAVRHVRACGTIV